MKFSASSAETPGSSWPHGCSGKAMLRTAARRRRSFFIWNLMMDLFWMFFFYISLNPHLTETGSQAGACGSPWRYGGELLDSLTPISFELKTSDLPGWNFCAKGLIKLDKSRQFQNMYLNYTWKYAAPIRQKRFKTTKWRQIVLKIFWRWRWVVDNPMFFYKTQILNFRRFCFSQYS